MRSWESQKKAELRKDMNYGEKDLTGMWRNSRRNGEEESEGLRKDLREIHMQISST